MAYIKQKGNKRMRSVYLLVIAVSLAGVLNADGPTQETVAPVAARYAIVQSSFAMRYVFKLDRYTGRIWELLNDDAGSSVWQEIAVIGLDRPVNAQSPRFQISLSGVGMRNVLLLDTVTGSTWVLLQIVSDVKDDGRLPGQAWVPVGTSKSPYPDGPFIPATKGSGQDGK